MKIRCSSVFKPCVCVVIGEPGDSLEVVVVVVAVVHAMASTSTPATTRRRGERIGRGVYRRPPAQKEGYGSFCFQGHGSKIRGGAGFWWESNACVNGLAVFSRTVGRLSGLSIVVGSSRSPFKNRSSMNFA